MTTYNVSGGSGITVKVTYEDPAGGFAGWFLHIVHGDGLADGDCSDNASALNASLNAARVAFLEGVAARLATMFGSDAVVRWSAQLVETVTPATIDTDCPT